MKKHTDVLIVGASAAGITAAVFAKRNNKNLDVTIVDRNDKIGNKLLKTGNGRCNLTNKNIDISHYHGQNIEMICKTLNLFSFNDTIQFLNSIGLILTELEEGRIYPYTLQAITVVDALKIELERLNIHVYMNTKVNNISKTEDGFIVKTADDDICSEKVVLACGGNSMPKTGSDGNGVNLAKSLGHKATKCFPSLVKVKSTDEVLKTLKGVRCNADVSLFANNKLVQRETGQVQFAQDGISGICVMQLSRQINVLQQRRLFISIDLMPLLAEKELTYYMKTRQKNLKSYKCEELLTGFLNRKLAVAVLKKANAYLNKLYCKDIDDNQIRMIAKTVKDFRLSDLSTDGFKESQVTSGGLRLNEFNMDTMESKLCKGLYACGEIMDVDGDCGGYNLQWAWTSGNIAGVNSSKTKTERK